MNFCFTTLARLFLECELLVAFVILSIDCPFRPRKDDRFVPGSFPPLVSQSRPSFLVLFRGTFHVVPCDSCCLHWEYVSISESDEFGTCVG
jgi:hypothetical protein